MKTIALVLIIVTMIGVMSRCTEPEEKSSLPYRIAEKLQAQKQSAPLAKPAQAQSAPKPKP